MNNEVLLSYIVSMFSAALSGVWAFIMANRKAKENIKRMQQQLKPALQLVSKIMDRAPFDFNHFHPLNYMYKDGHSLGHSFYHY